MPQNLIEMTEMVAPGRSGGTGFVGAPAKPQQISNYEIKHFCAESKKLN